MNITTRHPNIRRSLAVVAAFAVLATACNGKADERADGIDPAGAGVANATTPDQPPQAVPAQSPGTPADVASGQGAGDDDPVDEAGDDAEDQADLLDDSAGQPEQEPDPQPDGGDGGGGGGGWDEPVDLDPVPQGEPHPCDSLVADGSSLVVGPDPLVLDTDDLDGTLFVVNCSDGDIDWAAATKPSVSLSNAGANLLPGETVELDFTIDDAAWGPGAIDFKIKVSEPGHNHYVDIHAYQQLTGKDIVAGGGGLSAGEGAGGCSLQCITSALLRPNLTSPNLGIDITTNTPAKIRTWVSDAPPVDVDGVPTFPGVQPMDVSPAGATTHHGVLKPLQAGTKYYIVVGATDANDHSAYRSGSFTTITPVELPGGIADAGGPSGCATSCITKAQVTPGTDHTSKHIAIASHTAARFQVSVSDEAPNWSGDVPSFSESDFWAPSGLDYTKSWETDITGLAAGTGYHVIVSATDAEDRTHYAVGQFHTPAAPTFDVVYTVLGIYVDDDGDKGINRGELRFRWRVGDSHAGSRGEEKVSTGDWVTFPRPVSTFVAGGVTEWLPTVYIAALERDPDGKGEFCAMGTGTPTSHGSNADCDVVWSVASSGLVTLDGIDGYPVCTDLGFDPVYDDHRCFTLTTAGSPSGYPDITAYVAVEVNG